MPKIAAATTRMLQLSLVTVSCKLRAPWKGTVELNPGDTVVLALMVGDEDLCRMVDGSARITMRQTTEQVALFQGLAMGMDVLIEVRTRARARTRARQGRAGLASPSPVTRALDVPCWPLANHRLDRVVTSTLLAHQACLPLMLTSAAATHMPSALFSGWPSSPQGHRACFRH